MNTTRIRSVYHGLHLAALRTTLRLLPMSSLRWLPHRDWYYAIHRAEQPAAKGGPIYGRGKSRRVTYCLSCHDDYDRSIGGLVPSSLLPR